jgi:hypothetical protein
MFRKPSSFRRQLTIALALAFGATSAALADDSSMSPITGDSFRYFNGGNNLENRNFTGPVFSNVATDPAWRQSHPNGLTERELQASSSSDLSAFGMGFNQATFASAPTDPSWRQSHPNGMTERELMAFSSSSDSRWRLSVGSGYAEPGDQHNVAERPSTERLSARLARFFHPTSGAQAGIVN